MDPFNVIQTKAKRVRSNPTKKWLLGEEKSLVEFLTHNREFEKPTSQICYRRFAKENNIAMDWKRHARRSDICKAKAWEGSIIAGSMEGETIKSTLLKMCTFFYEVDEIFGGLESNDNYSEVDLNESASAAAVNECECGNRTTRKGIYSRTASSDILQFQSEIIQLKKQKIQQEISFKEKELQLRERELVIKEMELRAKQKLILKDKEMEMKLKESQRKIKNNGITNARKISNGGIATQIQISGS